MSIRGQHRVILSSGNISHFHHIALALQEIGLLERYYCTVFGLSSYSKWHYLLPNRWHKKLQGKFLPGINPELVYENPLPYIISQGLRQAGVISSAMMNLLFNNLYDQQICRKISECAVFHFVNGQGLNAARKVKQRGGILVCGVREAHINTYEALLLEEYATLDLPYKSSMSLCQPRMLEELEVANYIVATTDYTAQTYVANGFPREKILLATYGVDQVQYDLHHMASEIKPSRLVDGIFRVLFIGQIDPLKGLHYLLRAFSELNLPKSELIIIGGNSIGSWLSPEAKNERIHFLGHLPRVDLQQYYQCSSVFVLPSIVDSFGMVIPEAMAAGLPVIVSENVGAKEIVRNGQDGFIVPIRDVEALKEKLLWFFEHSEERYFMGQQAKQRVQEFTWERYREKIKQIYRKIFHDNGLM